MAVSPVVASATAPRRGPALGRIPFLLAGLVCLVGAIWGGLVRVGFVGLPMPGAVAVAHGPAMIGGFFGAVIGLERAVALGTRWSYAAPLLCALGGAAALSGLGGPAAGILMLTGSAVFVAVNVVLAMRVRAVFAATVAMGSVALLLSTAAWAAGVPFPLGTKGWLAFLVLTIVGERMELSRLVAPTRWGAPLFIAGVLLLIVGAFVAPWAPTSSVSGGVYALGLLVLPFWAVRHDVAKQTLGTRGLPRYVAVSVMAGYAWMLCAALLCLWCGTELAGPRYDAMVHALSIGLVFGMVLAHAPIIVPAVVRVRFPFNRALYVPLVLLHASLVVRILGDVTAEAGWRPWGALGNVVAIAAFLLVTVTSLVRAR